MQGRLDCKYKIITSLVFFFILISSNICVSAEEKAFITTRAISAELAKQAASTAYKDCRSKGYQVAVAVVDRKGMLMAFIRDPLASPHTIDVSQRKAYTSATYQASTSSMIDREEFRFTPGVLLLGGGLPINVAGHFYGAIAVSGAPGKKVSGDIDEECAQAGLSAIAETLEFSD